MKVSKEEFVAEIMRRQEARKEIRAAEQLAQKDFVIDAETPQDLNFYDYLNSRKYRGKYRVATHYQC